MPELKEGDEVTIVVPVPIPEPFVTFSIKWQSWAKTLSHTNATLKNRYQLPGSGTSHDGFNLMTYAGKPPSGIVKWLPVGWIHPKIPDFNITITAIGGKKICDCDKMKVIWFGCKKGHR